MVRNWKNVVPLFPSVVGAEVRLVKKGCANRNYFQIGVCPRARRPDLAPNEVIGAYDPMPNERGEKLVSLDVDRFAYWLGQGAHLDNGIKNLLGLVGVTPISPEVILTALKNRRDAAKGKKKLGGPAPHILSETFDYNAFFKPKESSSKEDPPKE